MTERGHAARGNLALAAAFAAFALVSTDARAADGEREAPAPKGACVSVRTEAVYRAYGYDHLVHLDNQCKKPMHCVVTTSAAPDPIEVDLEVDETRTLTTFRGSPAREHTANVNCEERGS